MSEYIKTLRKFLPLALAFIIVFESEVPLFAAINDFTADRQALMQDVSSDLSAIDNAYLRAQGTNEFEEELSATTQNIIKSINTSKEKVNIAKLKAEGKAKYGVLWPMYAEAAGQTSLTKLEADLKAYLAEYYSSLEIMPYDSFQKEYESFIKEQVEEFVSSKNCPAEYKAKSLDIIKQIKAEYPDKVAYQEYKAYAEKMIVWRKANPYKVEAQAYEVVRAYISAIEAPLLTGEVASILMKTEFNGEPALSAAEKEEIYNYNITRLEKQKLDRISSGLLSSKSERKAAAFLLASVTESIIKAGLTAKDGDARLASAVENIIYLSEEGPAFNYILSSGFASLLARKNYSTLRQLLSHYNEMELKSPAWYEYFSLGHYAENIKNASGTYLGKASRSAQYSTDIAYQNAFTDIAELLAEENSSQARKLLTDFAFDKQLDEAIKPFVAGALIYGKTPKSDKAELLANISFGDIFALQEYDLDTALLRKYPSIKGNLTEKALVTLSARQAKEDTLNNYGYLTRAADASDLFLAVWGGISLFKLGISGVKLAKSSYVAVKAANIAEKGARIAYIKANYVKIMPYVSAKRSLMRFGLKFKTFFNKNFNPRTFIKLENDLRNKKLAVMKASAELAKNTAAETGKAADVAKASFAQAQYSTMRAGGDLINKYRMVNMESLIGKYNAYKSGAAGVLPKQLLSANETKFMGSLYNYAVNAKELNHAFAAYFPHMSFTQRSSILIYNKLSSWWKGIKNAVAAYRARPKFTPFVDITAQPSNLSRHLALVPANITGNFGKAGSLSTAFAPASSLRPVKGRRFIPTPKYPVHFMPELLRDPFIPEAASFKIASDGLGSGYYIKKGALDLPLIFTAAHVVGDAKTVQVRNTNGYFTNSGRVINIKKDVGYDLAAILLEEPSFLEGIIPFKLGSSTPENKTWLRAHSYPDGDYYITSFVEMKNNNYVNPLSEYPAYEVTPSTILPGSSGGAVTLGDFDGTVVGMVSSLAEQSGNVLLVPINLIRDFYTDTVKKLLFDPTLRKTYLPVLPSLQARYPNLIAKYPNGKESYLTEAIEERLSRFNYDRFLSASSRNAERILQSSVFKIQRGDNYGSAVYIDYRGFNALLTARHVLEGDAPIQVISPIGEISTAEIFSKSPANGRDLAILIPHTENFLTAYKPLQLSHRVPKLGMPLFSAGYQNELFTFKDHKLLHDRFYVTNSGLPGDLNYSVGYYGLSGATAPGNSGAPVISEDGLVFGLSSQIISSSDISLAIRYSVIRDFIRQSIVNRFLDPYFDSNAFVARYPVLASNYINVIKHFRNNGFSTNKQLLHGRVEIPTDNYSYEGNLLDPSSSDGMSDGLKNLRFWFSTKVLGRSPKTVLKSLYQQGAMPRVYVPLRYSGKTYEISSLKPFFVTRKSQELYPQFPFTNVRAYAHRGMALNEEGLLNIMKNGLRKADMRDQSLAILSPHVTPGTKLQALSFSPYAAVSAQYATVNLSEETPLPILVDVMGINKNTALVNVHGMFTSRDIPPEKIVRYSTLLNIGGMEQWGELLANPAGGFTFKPYKFPKAVPVNSNAAVFARESMNLAYGTPGGFEETLKTSPAVTESKNLQPASGRRNPVSEITTIENVLLQDAMKRSVWEAKNADGEIIGYLKYAEKDEFKRTKQIDEIIKKNNLLEKYDLLEIEYSSLLTEDLSALPENILQQLNKERAELFPYLRKNDKNTLFLLKKVDTSGFILRCLKRRDIALLNDKPITDDEWVQIVEFYQDLHKEGFYHTDIWANLHIRRLENGKLKITLLDFENISDTSIDMRDLKSFEEDLIIRGLKKDFSPIMYPSSIMPSSYSDFFAPRRGAPELDL